MAEGRKINDLEDFLICNWAIQSYTVLPSTTCTFYLQQRAPSTSGSHVSLAARALIAHENSVEVKATAEDIAKKLKSDYNDLLKKHNLNTDPFAMVHDTYVFWWCNQSQHWADIFLHSAGFGACCNHVVAAMYKVEFANEKGLIDPACTDDISDVLCYWNQCFQGYSTNESKKHGDCTTQLEETNQEKYCELQRKSWVWSETQMS